MLTYVPTTYINKSGTNLNSFMFHSVKILEIKKKHDFELALIYNFQKIKNCLKIIYMPKTFSLHTIFSTLLIPSILISTVVTKTTLYFHMYWKAYYSWLNSANRNIMSCKPRFKCKFQMIEKYNFEIFPYSQIGQFSCPAKQRQISNL